jgi:hypothetical protein
MISDAIDQRSHPGAMSQSIPFRLILCIFLASVVGPVMASSQGSSRYEANGQTYAYTFKQTGDNHTFVFDQNPGGENQRLRAVSAVFRTVYGDDSIAQTHNKEFMKEGAHCYVFPATFHAYTACFLPNDYAPQHRGRFWGFVSRVPNLAWLITYNLLPVLLVTGAFFMFLRKERYG